MTGEQFIAIRPVAECLLVLYEPGNDSYPWRPQHGLAAEMLMEQMLSALGISAKKADPEPQPTTLDDVDVLRRLLIQRLKGMPYEKYLQTEHWRHVRILALERAGGRCQLCNKTERLQVHHRTYERRGEEKPEDVTVVCRPCHARHHGKPV